MIRNTYRKLFGPSRKDLLELVIKRVAVLAGDVKQLQRSLACYNRLLEQTDPHTDWWHFAEYKQRVHDLTFEVEAADRKLAKAEHEFEAYTADDDA